MNFLETRILAADDPRTLGKALHGQLSGLWSYRVGDYRIISRMEDNVMTILVLRVGHRDNIYDRPLHP